MFKQCVIALSSLIGSMLSMTCSICFGMSLHSCDVMDSVVLNKCFSFAAPHTPMVNWFCVGVPFGLGAGFGVHFGALTLVTLEVRECLGFLVGAVGTVFQVSAQHIGARLLFRGDFHDNFLLAFGNVLNFAMVGLRLSVLNFAKLHFMSWSCVCPLA